ncbi:hypothetical protein Syun_027086 [Stephania yunnanensis]|uniref:PEP-utilising enzyme C-terminal domain-containing protein n=1 Tax=Stephania yunnanensis TaxID=152371 RepID=A0AAP0HQZ4_9MAGN
MEAWKRLNKEQIENSHWPKAFIDAAINLAREQTLDRVTYLKSSELEHQVSLIRDVSKKVFSEMGTSIGYKIGTMIEIPRAALVADEIAEQVEFFSFGTNDLTQMTFGYER